MKEGPWTIKRRKQEDERRKQEIFPGHAAFERLGRVIDALPERLPDDVPLRDAMPGAWPTVGDLRKMREEFEDVCAIARGSQ